MAQTAEHLQCRCPLSKELKSECTRLAFLRFLSIRLLQRTRTVWTIIETCMLCKPVCGFVKVERVRRTASVYTFIKSEHISHDPSLKYIQQVPTQHPWVLRQGCVSIPGGGRHDGKEPSTWSKHRKRKGDEIRWPYECTRPSKWHQDGCRSLSGGRMSSTVRKLQS